MAQICEISLQMEKEMERSDFQDETWFEIENNEMSHAWAENKSDIPSTICKKMNDYHMKIHLMGVIGYEAPIFIKQVEGNIDSQVFIDFIYEFMTEDQSDSILCFDMAKFHTSNKTTKCLVSQNVDYLTLPPKGADINFIKNVWSVSKSDVWKNLKRKMNKEQLFKICETIFYNSPLIKQTIQNGYNSLHKPIHKIIERNGDLYKI